MAMGKKKRRQQEDLWVATSQLPRTAGHPFYERLNRLFDEHGFDDFVEELCAKFYADSVRAWVWEHPDGCRGGAP